jgi:hypothetical protein
MYLIGYVQGRIVFGDKLSWTNCPRGWIVQGQIVLKDESSREEFVLQPGKWYDNFFKELVWEKNGCHLIFEINSNFTHPTSPWLRNNDLWQQNEANALSIENTDANNQGILEFVTIELLLIQFTALYIRDNDFTTMTLRQCFTWCPSKWCLKNPSGGVYRLSHGKN